MDCTAFHILLSKQTHGHEIIIVCNGAMFGIIQRFKPALTIGTFFNYFRWWMMALVASYYIYIYIYIVIFESLTLEFYVLYVLNMHIKFHSN